MKHYFKSNIKLKISIGFLAALIAFIAVQILSDKSIENLKDSEKQMLNSSQLSKTIGTIESAIDAYESKITGFVLTGNRSFLDNNEENLREATVNLEYIHHLRMSSVQSDLVMELDSLVNAQINFNEQALIAYDKAHMDDAISLINTGKSKQLINNIHNISNRILQLEENNLARLILNNDSFSNKVVFMDYAASSFAFAVIFFSIFILFRDINKRNTIEKELRVAQQKAEQSAILKEQFMANMSHEIRTPMNAIIGFANLLGKSDLDKTQSKHISAIQTSGETLLSIINDILDFSKIEAGVVSIENIPFNPEALLHSVIMMFIPKANEKNIQLTLQASPMLPETVLGDPARLTQILTNLVSNALKFTAEGSILIKADPVDEKQSRQGIRFIIKDTGIGIPKEKQVDIFERFTQAHAESNRKYGGSGLGLSIVKKLVELQEGTIHLDSAEGVGSSFTFFIPYKTALASTLSPAVETKQPAMKANTRILVAEDNLLNQYLTKSLLGEWDVDFEIVANGKLAVERLKEKTFDLVLMDIQMPEMNGYDAARFIRQDLFLTIPIIAMTAHVLPGEKEKCFRCGMTDYISKPFRESDLYNMIVKYVKTNGETNRSKTEVEKFIKDNQQVSNLSYLHELANGNQEFVDEMISLFQAESPKEIQLLENAISHVDYPAIYSLSHKLKSTIAYAGLDLKIKKELTEIGELALKKINLSQIEADFLKVKETCLKAMKELACFKTTHV